MAVERISAGPVIESDLLERLYQGVVYKLAAGDAVNVPTAGATRMAVILGSGATLRWSRVNTAAATAHRSGDTTDVSVQPTAATDVAWSFHRIEAIGGAVEVCFLP